MSLASLSTPCALVDRTVVERNTRRMAEHIAALGCRLRPHVKTHKTAEGARLQVRGHFGGITVSTLAEAEHLAKAGFDDITYAVPLSPGRIERALKLSARIPTLHLLLDHASVLVSLERAAALLRTQVSVFLKVDCGTGRAGVDPTSEDAVALAAALHGTPHIDFRGLLSHAGHSYEATSIEEVAAIAADERRITVDFARKLRAAGIPVPEVSIGSTPTCVHTSDLEGVTEVRPGNYSLFDAFQLRLGSCGLEDIALSVLTTVIGSYPERGRLLVDAGALALSKDAGARHLAPDCGYGILCDEDGAPVEGLHLAGLSQEHGEIDVADASLFERFAPGKRLRVLPNHSCLTAAMYAHYVVVQDGEIVGDWEPVKGW